MKDLAPSLLSANFANLEDDIGILDKCGVNYIHLDIMDGNYVPNISFGPGLVSAIRPLTDMVFDTHLMIEEPERYVDDFVEAGSDIITIHYESTVHQHRLIQRIKSAGLKAGISLNPATPLNVLDYIIEDLDLVLIMSVNPGFSGQAFIPAMEDKLRSLAKIKRERGLDFIIEVDGGIKTSNVERVLEAGAELIVSGSDVFGTNSIEDRIREYKEIFNG